MNGKTLPSDLTMGSYEIRDLTNKGVGTLFEGKVIYDKTYGGWRLRKVLRRIRVAHPLGFGSTKGAGFEFFSVFLSHLSAGLSLLLSSFRLLASNL